ncbi:MAG: hypothetical protein JOY95_02480 [Silvibacterium sp.]|nr:hypothetical protein [Silvibacterium sp.]
MLAASLLFCTAQLSAQDAESEPSHAGHVPVLSGGLGYVYNVNGGTSTLSPIIDPVLLLALGSHVLVESRADFVGVFQRRNGNGDYTGQVFSYVDYAQIDWLANTHAMVVAGKYITPFGIYAERLVPIWISTFQSNPLTYSVGTRTSGAGVGGQLRGVVAQTNKYSVQYSAYFSAFSSVYQLDAARTTGFDASVYFPVHRFEVGTSYQRFLQQRHINSEAAYVSWQPPHIPLDVKAEYDHSYYGHGYWIQAAYTLSQVPVANSFFKRMELGGRMEQVFPLNGGGNGLPRIDTQRPGVALNYYIRDDLRLVSSYQRQFSSAKDVNIWNIGFTYRWQWPLWPGRE